MNDEGRMVKNNLWIALAVLFCKTLLVPGCNPERMETEAYLAELDQWRTERLKKLKSRNGWINLAGLYWLHAGMNTFGSDSSNTLVFPEKAPAFIGTIELRGDSVFLHSLLQPVMTDSLPVSGVRLRDDSQGKSSIMTLQSFAWNVIKRGDRFGIRLRDFENPMSDNLSHIPCFTADPAFRVKARFKAYPTPERIKVPTIMGTEEENLIAGELHFRISGKKRVLYPFKEDEGLFLVFGDLTNGEETYAAGRFLYTDAPDEDGLVILDFNRAYNPPCAFTPFATCPLPIRKNILPVHVKAGEKAVHLSPVH
jgi:hypothetical protein